ncbi:hypothetical protein MAR_033764 [Mya arenaria]|uniref:Uncharacterized protein n=1 Tax=Mya arenaria TaxID=6604 RepID=A0ABY7G9Y1_MYAAR|nr:hypothetical protein MAR_033764 [Mya arenaria]
MQKRIRSCTNPAPAFTGNHCFGEQSDYRVCNMQACVGVLCNLYLCTTEFGRQVGMRAKFLVEEKPSAGNDIATTQHHHYWDDTVTEARN